MLQSALLAIFIILATVISALFYQKWKDRPPGPLPWPFIGNILLMKRLSKKCKGRQHIAFMELSKQYNSDVIALRIGNNDMIVVNGNESIQTLLNDEAFDGRPWNDVVKLRNFGLRKGVTMNDGQEWKEMRNWLMRSLRCIGFGKPIMSDMIKNELIQVLKILEGGGVHTMKIVIAPAVINVLWTLTTGKRFGEINKLNSFLDKLQQRARILSMSGLAQASFNWIRRIFPNASGYNLLIGLNNSIKDFIMETIHYHKGNYVPGNTDDLINIFLGTMLDRPKSCFTEENLFMILTDLFLAGSHTTTTTLDFLFINMVSYPNIQRRVQEEIDVVIGKERLPDLNDRVRMPYTQAVLMESQRMWLVTPIIGPRRVLHDTILCGYKIPKNSTVIMNAYSVNMDPKLFPEPEIFKPERFIENERFRTDENVITFGKGRRRCPGETLAKSALFLLFVGIMQKFELLPIPETDRVIVEAIPGMTITPKPYKVTLVPRNP